MEESKINKPEIKAESVEKTECYEHDNCFSSDNDDIEFDNDICDDDSDDDSVFEYNNKMVLLEISPLYPLAGIINNMVMQYLDLIEHMAKTENHPTLLAEKVSDFYSEIPFNMLNTRVLQRLKKLQIAEETRTVTLYKTILNLLDVIEGR